MLYLVHNNPDLKEVDDACKIFGLIDKNGNGKINKEELFNGLSDEEIVEILYSTIHNNVINYGLKNN